MVAAIAMGPPLMTRWIHHARVSAADWLYAVTRARAQTRTAGAAIGVMRIQAWVDVIGGRAPR